MVLHMEPLGTLLIEETARVWVLGVQGLTQGGVGVEGLIGFIGFRVYRV